MKEFNIILVVICIQIVVGLTEKIRNAELIRDDDEPLQGELGEFFEGDMMLTEKQKMSLFSSSINRNGLVDIYRRWPKNTLIYYFVDDEFSEYEKTVIRTAMWDIENNSCVRFQERQNNEYATRITNKNRGCWAHVGYSREELAEQTVNLERNCFYAYGTIVHEFLHALGFYHMQSTYNRDDYVCIAWRNIEEGYEHNFYKYDNTTVTNFGVDYDYNSVLHYPSNAFSKNGRNTIITLEPGVMIGQRVGLSRGDIIKLNRMYNCYPQNVLD